MESLKHRIKNKEKDFSSEGFSLIELLIAAAVAIIVLGIVGLVYVSSERSFRFGRAAIESEADLRLAMDWLIRDIREAQSLSISDDTVTLQIPPYIASDDVVYVRTDDNKLIRSQGTSTKVIITDLTEFDISTDDTVSITLSSIKPRLRERRILTSKVTMRNAQ